MTVKTLKGLFRTFIKDQTQRAMVKMPPRPPGKILRANKTIKLTHQGKSQYATGTIVINKMMSLKIPVDAIDAIFFIYKTSR